MRCVKTAFDEYFDQPAVLPGHARLGAPQNFLWSAGLGIYSRQPAASVGIHFRAEASKPSHLLVPPAAMSRLKAIPKCRHPPTPKSRIFVRISLGIHNT